MEEYNNKRKEFLINNEKLNFSNDIVLNHNEWKFNKILIHEVEKFNKLNKNLSYNNYFEFKKNIKNSSFYNFLNKMPKGAIHHFHNNCAFDYKLVYDFCDEDFVYFNMKEKIFKVIFNNKNKEIDGYLKTNYLKKSMGIEFKLFLKKELTMTIDEMSQGDPTDIFSKFEHKFTMIYNLFFYKPFFMKLLENSINILLEQKVYIQEWRHVFGSLYDEKGIFSIEEEFDTVKELINYGKAQNPNFELSIIACGLKIFGKEHISKTLDSYHKYKKDYKFLVGYDLVCDEDKFLDLKEYLEIIKDYEEKNKVETIYYIHAGESYKRKNFNLIDAYLMNTKRIGHGNMLSYFPNLVDNIKKKDICVEVNPISNFVLGYTPNLKNHPMKFLIQNGLQISISSDDYGFFGYKGVTLDYAFILSQWQLNLKDLKKLCLNSIKYSSAKDKDLHYKIFNKKWDNLIISELSKIN